MTEEELVREIMRELDLPAGQYVVSGSAVMVLHGIRRTRPMGDLDIFLATRPWMTMALSQQRVIGGVSSSRWKVWTTDPDDPARRCDPPYLKREIHGLEVNIFHSWRRRGVGDIDVAHWIHNAERVQGFPCIPLGFLLDWKLVMGRSKDLDDIRLIREHLAAV